MNETLTLKIESLPARSAWAKAVKLYALELIESAEVELTRTNAKVELLNGADNWSQYSFGGCSLIYDSDIAERVCSPSELKKTKGGERQPNAREGWLDCQARALGQAFRLIVLNLPRE